MRRTDPAAWRARSKPLKRGSGPTVKAADYPADNRRRNSTLNQRSATLSAYYRHVRAPLVARIIAESRGCEAYRRIPADELPCPCWGPLDVHERRRRSASGSLSNLLNLVTICRRHHDLATNCKRGDVWHRHGLVVLRGDPEYQALRAPRRERLSTPGSETVADA